MRAAAGDTVDDVGSAGTRRGNAINALQAAVPREAASTSPPASPASPREVALDRPVSAAPTRRPTRVCGCSAAGACSHRRFLPVVLLRAVGVLWDRTECLGVGADGAESLLFPDRAGDPGIVPGGEVQVVPISSSADRPSPVWLTVPRSRGLPSGNRFSGGSASAKFGCLGSSFCGSVSNNVEQNVTASCRSSTLSAS